MPSLSPSRPRSPFLSLPPSPSLPLAPSLVGACASPLLCFSHGSPAGVRTSPKDFYRGGQDPQTEVPEAEAEAEVASEAEAEPAQLLLLGDSITENLITRQTSVLRDGYGDLSPAVFAISGDSTHHLRWRLQNGGLPPAASWQAPLVSLLIGTNDLGAGGPPHNPQGTAVPQVRTLCAIGLT